MDNFGKWLPSYAGAEVKTTLAASITVLELKYKRQAWNWSFYEAKNSCSKIFVSKDDECGCCYV